MTEIKTDRALKMIESMLRGGKKPSRRILLACHAELQGARFHDAITPSARQLDTLLRLDEHERKFGVPARLIDIAAQAGITPPTLSEAVRALLAMGLVERVVPGAALPSNVRLTKKGLKWVRENGFVLERDGVQPQDETETPMGEEAQQGDD